MGRLSRGCLRCRQRRVRCDEDRPSCRRCIQRNEVCEGYRDESTLVFRYETGKVIQNLRGSEASGSPSNSLHSAQSSTRNRSRSVDASASSSSRPGSIPGIPNADPSALSTEEAAGVKLRSPYPWLKELPDRQRPPVEEQAVDQFLNKFVVYPCNHTSSPGFLEHLPSMFKEVNVEGRCALRLAVRAAGYADVSRDQESKPLAVKALQCYGMALEALGQSLSTPGKEPDDYDLMTIVILDIFETLYAPCEARKGSHVQGMAQMLRLRGKDLVYSPRGWSLFRLAHHRIQKHQLAYGLSRVTETPGCLDQLNDDEPYVRLERKASEIGETCKRARLLLDAINAEGLPLSTVIERIRELNDLDHAAVSWRRGSQWYFTDIAISQRPDLLPAARGITDTIQLHSDVWMAYEWNYHRTARIIFLQQLLQCCRATLNSPDLTSREEQGLNDMVACYVSKIQQLTDDILATVPQSLGAVDHLGRLQASNGGSPRGSAVGGYMLLWPTRTTKAASCPTTPEQKQRVERVFDKIREYTGMKELLGDKSMI